MKRVLTLALISIFACGGIAAQAEDDAVKLQESQKVAPDNTKKNTRDKHKAKVTPEDQSNAASDVDVTRNIRKSIMSTKGLSVDAQNVKIITENGTVTLRGPVASQQEKDVIDALAKQACGTRAFTNQLEIKGQNSSQ